MKKSSKILATLAGAAGAAAAGYYFYASTNAKSHRKVAAKWATNLKDDVVRRAKEVGEKIDKKTMMKIVDGAASAYKSVRGLDRKELSRAVTELKKNWHKLAGELTKKKGKK
jgi:prophage DNA circulation protein